jgi:hypothetical protein
MKAIQLQTKGESAIFVENRPVPALPKDCLLVKTIAVGLNPHELLDIDPPWSLSDAGDLLGCDYAGIVEDVGSEVKRNFKKGDRVCDALVLTLCNRTGEPSPSTLLSLQMCSCICLTRWALRMLLLLESRSWLLAPWFVLQSWQDSETDGISWTRWTWKCWVIKLDVNYWFMEEAHP